jgi:uncharacterized membrane protein YjjB (DUF3815 family)
MILQVLGAMFGVIWGSIYLEAPKKHLLMGGLIGGLGWFAYLIALKSFDLSLSTFISGLIIAILSHGFARRVKTPVTMFLIPGFLPLVPGVSLYHAVYEFMKGSSLGNTYLLSTFQVAGMIALSIFVVDSFVKILEKQIKK